jgi:hypothetical protein
MLRSQYLQQLADELCDRHNLVRVPVVEDHTLLQDVSNKAAYDPYPATRKIIIDERLDDEDAFIGLYHEWKHYWQHTHYEELFLWWMNHEQASFYREQYDSVFCSIEEDAHIFGFSHGEYGREDLLQEFDVETLAEMKACPEMIRIWLDLAGNPLACRTQGQFRRLLELGQAQNAH